MTNKNHRPATLAVDTEMAYHGTGLLC